MIIRYELDPIAREVYVTRGKGGIFAIVSIDGWLKVLDRTDHYDGFTVEIHHDDKGTIDWVGTCIHSTKRKYPAVYRAYAAEYARVAGMVAEQLPSHMLRIFSLRHAARLFVPLSSCIATEEEVQYVERQQDARQTRTLDDLTDRLTRPIEPVAETPQPADELPETSFEPPAKQEQLSRLNPEMYLLSYLITCLSRKLLAFLNLHKKSSLFILNNPIPVNTFNIIQDIYASGRDNFTTRQYNHSIRSAFYMFNQWEASSA